MIINTNLNAMNAYRSMGIASTKQGLAMEKLSSGNKINRAADDAAGLAISEKMRSQINGLVQASRNAQDGVSLIQTAEGALSETQAINQRMKELAVQSANGIYEEEDRKLINQEFTQLKEEIDRIAEDTEFNGSKLLNGDRSGKTIDPNWTYEQLSGNNTKGDITSTVLGKVFTDSITKEESLKLGEGTFELRVYVGETTLSKKEENGPFFELDEGDIKLQLVDMSNYNGGKEYVMGETIIKKPNATDKKVKLGDVELNLVGKGGLDTITTRSFW